MKSIKNNDATLQGQLKDDAMEVVQLEERLEMVQADSLVALASCCMDSKETVKE